jgi:hypothetical protein
VTSEVSCDLRTKRGCEMGRGRAGWLISAGFACLFIVGPGCDDCPDMDATAAARGGQMCAYGTPGGCCSDVIWRAVCRDGRWVCPPTTGYPGGIYVEQCRREGCSLPGSRQDAAPNACARSEGSTYPSGAPSCAYGYPNGCCSDSLWAAVCRNGSWVCEAGGGHEGGILSKMCRQTGCSVPGASMDGAVPDGPSSP